MTDDLISRLAAITLPVIPKEHREYQTFNLDDAYEQGWNDLQKYIESLPSAQPKQKTGKWIVYYECPKCGEITKNFTGYCPFCNADMGGKEENDAKIH